MKPFIPMKGIQVAAITPFKRNPENNPHQPYTIDTSVIEHYSSYLSQNGASGVFVGGVTGDFTILTTEERLDLQAAWLQTSIRSKLNHVIIHIGGPFFEDVIKLGVHASENSASAVAITFPSFPAHAPQTETHLIEYLSRVSFALPDIPLLIYNISGTTPSHYVNNLYPLLKKAIDGNKVPTLVGLKYSSTNFIDAFELKTYLGLDIAIGCDEQMLAACAMGFTVSAIICHPFKCFHGDF